MVYHLPRADAPWAIESHPVGAKGRLRRSLNRRTQVDAGLAPHDQRISTLVECVTLDPRLKFVPKGRHFRRRSHEIPLSGLRNAGWSTLRQQAGSILAEAGWLPPSGVILIVGHPIRVRQGLLGSRKMPEWAMSLIALVCGIAGLSVGYALGYRNGC